MQEQFPHAGLELVHRYEHELSRVHHLQSKADLQRHTINGVTKRLAEAMDVHTAALNKILAKTAELQAKVDDAAEEHRMLDRSMSERQARLDRLAKDVATTRIGFAAHFVSRTEGAAAARRDALSPPRSGKPRVDTAKAFHDIDPTLVLQAFDAATKVFVENTLIPLPSDFDAHRRLASDIAVADNASNMRAVSVLLGLASASLSKRSLGSEVSLADGRILPHEHARVLREIESQRDEIRRTVASLAVGRPQLEAALCSSIGLEGGSPIAPPANGAHITPVDGYTSKPDVLRFSRRSPAAPSAVAVEFTRANATPDRVVPEAAKLREALREEVRRARASIIEEEHALELTHPGRRAAALAAIDAARFEESRQCVGATQPEPTPTAPMLAPHETEARVPRKPVWACEAARRPASASRYQATARKLGVTGARGSTFTKASTDTQQPRL
jgi:hypothetical protein